MDKKIKKTEKQVGKLAKDLKGLEKMDKRRDKACDMGKEMMKKGKR